MVTTKYLDTFAPGAREDITRPPGTRDQSGPTSSIPEIIIDAAQASFRTSGPPVTVDNESQTLAFSGFGAPPVNVDNVYQIVAGLNLYRDALQGDQPPTFSADPPSVNPFSKRLAPCPQLGPPEAPGQGPGQTFQQYPSGYFAPVSNPKDRPGT